MERNILPTLSPETNDDDKDTKKNKRKKRDGFAAPISFDSEKAKHNNPEKPEPSALDKAVADLMRRKRSEEVPVQDTEATKRLEKAKKSAAEPEPEKAEQPLENAADDIEPDEEDSASSIAEEPEATPKEDAAVPEKRTDEASEPSDETYDLPPTDLSGGEVIIHLQSPKPVDERVIPLHVSETDRDDTPDKESVPLNVQAAEEAAQQSEPASDEVPESNTGVHNDIPPTKPPETNPPSAEEPEPPERPEFVVRQQIIPDSFTTPSPTEAYARQTQQLEEELAQTPEVPAEIPPTTPVATRTASSETATSATKRDVEDAVYYATKHGQNRGVVAGALAFGGYEHFKHRHREKRQEKLAKQQTKKLQKSLEKEGWLIRNGGRQKEQTTNGQQVKQTENSRQMEQTIQTTHVQEASTIRQPEQTPIRAGAPERRFEAERPVPSAQRLPVQHFEQSSVTNWQLQSPERPVTGMAVAQESSPVLLPKPEQKPRVTQVAVAERLDIPPEHILQNSAWHSIEVDARTGKPVENPTFEYGHEYYRERAQEAGPKAPVDAAAGEAALVAAALSSSNAPATVDHADQPMLPSASAQITPQKTALKTVKKARANLQSNGPLWPLVVTFVVVVVLLVIVLR